MEDFKKQMLTEHLADLRSSLIYSFIAAGVGFALSYAFIKPIVNWFFAPRFKVLPDQDQTSLLVWKGEPAHYTSVPYIADPLSKIVKQKAKGKG